MCWVLYLASDVPLPTVQWDQEQPAFNVQALPRPESPVGRQFTKPYLYEVGSHTCCGCGFNRFQANPEHPEELKSIERSLDSLREYLRHVVAIAGELELYSCWDGDQAAELDHRWTMTCDDVSPTMQWFPDRTYVTVSERRI